MSLTILLPLFIALLMALLAIFYVLARKSKAQSLCVQQVVHLQHDLERPLRQLLHLNTRARALRAERLAADEALDAALASAYPPAIAAAQATQEAVILAQLELRSEQESQLITARRLRAESQRDLQLRVRAFTSGPGVQAHSLAPLGLAVRPTPVESLTPDYVPMEGFTHLQQQHYRFSTDIWRGFPWITKIEANLTHPQPTECSASLSGSEDQWQVRLIAAKASSR